MDIPVLICTSGTNAGKRFEVPEGGLTIGRAEDNDIILNEEGVSRYHARFLYDNGSLWLQDAGSRNGIFVNEHRVTNHQDLRVGDVIKLAEHIFEVRWDQPEAESPPAEEPEASTPDDAKASKRRWYWPF